MLVYEDGQIVGTVGGGTFEHRVIEVALKTIRSGAPARYSANLSRDLGMCCGSEMEAYIEPLETVVDLVIYGAGHVGAATARLADAAGFRVTLVDERPEFTEPEDHPRESVSSAETHFGQLDSLPWGMSAFHGRDPQPPGRSRPDRVDSPQRRGLGGDDREPDKGHKVLPAVSCGRNGRGVVLKLSAPVGLDIGAETPAEIAVSIVADLVRVKRRAARSPAPLSDTKIEARGGDGTAHPPALSVPE